MRDAITPGILSRMTTVGTRRGGQTKGYLRAHLLLDAVRHGVQHEAKVPLALGMGAGNLPMVVVGVVLEGLAAKGAEVRGCQRAELEQARAAAVRLEACKGQRDGGKEDGVRGPASCRGEREQFRGDFIRASDMQAGE